MGAKSSLWFCCIVLVSLLAGANCACTWPSALEGTWYTSESGNWTWDNNNTLVMDFATYGTRNFECYYTDGYRYLARISNIQVFAHIPGYLFDIFICLEFQQLSADSFLYWRANNVNPSLNNEKAYMQGIGFTADTSTACEITKPYSSGTHNIMVKTGQEAAAAVTCPPEFLSTTYYYYDYDLARECGPSNSSYDGCSATNTLSVNYTACADPGVTMFYSSGGAVYCLYYTTDNSVTYLSVLNKDASPDGSSTYRFSCVAFTKSGSAILATQHPESCLSTQTATSVLAPALTSTLEYRPHVTYKNYSQSSYARPVVVHHGFQNILFLFLSVLLVLLLTSDCFP